MPNAFSKKTALSVVHRNLAVIAIAGAILAVLAASHANWNIEFALSNQLVSGLMSLSNATLVGGSV